MNGLRQEAPTAHQQEIRQIRSLLSAGQSAKAAEACRRILRHAPEDPWAMHLLGTALYQLGSLGEAAALMKYATELAPDISEFHNNLGSVEASLGRPERAEERFRRALELQPASHQAANNLANALREQGRLEEAESVSREAVQAHGNIPECFNALGTILEHQGRTDEALKCFGRAIELNPQYVQAHMNRALGHLRLGKFELGWKENEWRLSQPGWPYQRPWPRPHWDGSELGGKTIVLHCEGGLGNVIQFSRFASLVVQRGGRVVLECPPQLVQLLRTLDGPAQIVPFGQPLPSFDVHASIVSLPALLGTTLENLPNRVPYLGAQRHLSDHFARELTSSASLAQKLRVGISWQGNPNYPNDRVRSIPLKYFGALADVPGVSLISLQQGLGAEQLSKVSFSVAQLAAPPQAPDASFTNAAALMEHLDLVITSDTAIAHLAGSLGVRVWLALSTAPCWRWMREREDSPWYPSMRLFRQQRRGDWRGLFDGMANELGTLGDKRTEAELACVGSQAQSPESEWP